MAKGVALERRVGAQRERLAKLGTRQRRRWLWAAWVLTVFAAVVPSLGVGELPSMRTPVLSEVHLEGANSALATCCLARFCGVPNRLRGGGGECAPSSEVETEEEDEDTGPDALYTAQQVCPNPPCCFAGSSRRTKHNGSTLEKLDSPMPRAARRATEPRHPAQR